MRLGGGGGRLVRGGRLKGGLVVAVPVPGLGFLVVACYPGLCSFVEIVVVVACCFRHSSA